MTSALKDRCICSRAVFMKTAFVFAVVLFSLQENVSAEFSPGNYAIYQFDRGIISGNQMVVEPLKSAGVTHQLSVWQSDIANLPTDKNDSAKWAVGPGWLLPVNDSTAPKALRFTGKNKYYASYATNTSGLSVSRAPDPSLQTFCFSFKVAKIDSTAMLFWTSLRKLRFYHTTGGYTDDSYFFSCSITASGNLLFGHNNKTYKSDDSMFDSAELDTVPYNIQTGQWYSAKIEISKNTRGEDFGSLIIGDSTLKTVQISNIGNDLKLVDGGVFIDFAQFPNTNGLSHDTTGKTEVDMADFGYFEGMSGKDVNSKYGRWEADPAPGSTDTLVYPAYITQVLYDPPGNGSSATLSSGQTITNSSKFNVGGSAGVTAFFGSEVASDVWTAGCGFDLQVTGGIKVSVDRETENTQTYAVTSGLQTSVDASMGKYIGPGRGDLVSYLPLKLERKLYRRPKINVLNPATDADYTYYLMSQILPDPNSKIHYTTIANMLETTKGDSSIYKYIQDEFAIDLGTHRVRKELIGNRLVARPDLDLSFSGGTPLNQSSTLTSSASVTHSISGTISAEVSTKIILGTIKVGGSLSFEATVGGSETSAKENTRTVAYTLADNEGWDNFKISTYYDKRFGVYVFDVDSAQSNSSWPYEDCYSRKSVDWQIVSADTLKSGVAGDVLDYTITVKNASLNLGGIPDPLTLNAEIVNYPDQASVFPTEVKIARNSNGTFIASLSSPKACTTSCILRISQPNPNGFGNPVISDIPLAAQFTPAVTGIYAECKNSVAVVKSGDPVSGNFQIVVRNIGAAAAQIETGVTSASDGVTYQLGTFANPVPAGDSVSVSVLLSGAGLKFPFTAKFWTKISGITESYKEILLTVADSGSIPVIRPAVTAAKARVLDIKVSGDRQLYICAPGSVPATLRIFDLSGRQIFMKTNILGEMKLNPASIISKGFTLVKLEQGKKSICRKIMVR